MPASAPPAPDTRPADAQRHADQGWCRGQPERHQDHVPVVLIRQHAQVVGRCQGGARRAAGDAGQRHHGQRGQEEGREEQRGRGQQQGGRAQERRVMIVRRSGAGPWPRRPAWRRHPRAARRRGAAVPRHQRLSVHVHVDHAVAAHVDHVAHRAAQRAVRAGSVLREAQVFRRSSARPLAGASPAVRVTRRPCACSRNAPPASTA